MSRKKPLHADPHECQALMEDGACIHFAEDFAGAPVERSEDPTDDPLYTAWLGDDCYSRMSFEEYRARYGPRQASTSLETPDAELLDVALDLCRVEADNAHQLAAEWVGKEGFHGDLAPYYQQIGSIYDWIAEQLRAQHASEVMRTLSVQPLKSETP